jgi:hypothetical protein
MLVKCVWKIWNVAALLESNVTNGNVAGGKRWQFRFDGHQCGRMAVTRRPAWVELPDGEANNERLRQNIELLGRKLDDEAKKNVLFEQNLTVALTECFRGNLDVCLSKMLQPTEIQIFMKKMSKLT